MIADWALQDAVFERTVECSFDAPLEEVLGEIGKSAGIPIHVEWPELLERDIRPDREISLRLGNVSAGTALARLSKTLPISMSVRVRDGVLVVTSRSAADADLSTCVYDVRPIMREIERQVAREPRAARTTTQYVWQSNGCVAVECVEEARDRLESLVQDSVCTDAWRVNGGAGSLRVVGGAMIISQHADGHRAVLRLLASLEQVALSGS